jgi:FkbM family methyltransferase
MDITNYKYKNLVINGNDQDHIYSIIKDSSDFYEIDILQKWGQYLSDVKVIIDIGANIGNHSIYWSQSDNIEKIIAFEPLKESYEYLKNNTIDNNIRKIESFNLAVGEKEGLVNNRYNKSLLEPNALEEDISKIKVISIDSFLLDKDYNADFIRIDVEGAEPLVLNGMIQTLNKSKPKLWIKITLNSLCDVFKVLNQANYAIVDIDNFNILAIHETKMGDFKQFSHEKIIYEMIKNLSTAFEYRKDYLANLSEIRTYRNKFLIVNNEKIAEENKNKELMDDYIRSISRFEHEKQRFENEKQKAADLTEQIKKSKSRFEYEQKKCENLQNQLQKREKLIETYKSRKIVRAADNFKKLYSSPGKYTKKYVYISLNMLYEKLRRFPRITRIIHKTNNRFNIIHKEAALETYYKHQNNYISKGLFAQQKYGPQQIKDIKVAVIMDEFTFNSFKDEFNAVVIEPNNWLEVFEKEKPELFFCESAWSGVDTKKRPWMGKIYSSINFKNENRLILLAILEYCKNNSIPTIFWNKEDPTHYNDKVHNFVDTALKFDHIFTTDEECVQRYKYDYGHENVHCLMFAGQPKILNPIERHRRTKDIVFAGSWYEQHPQRCNDMRKIFDKILESGYNLKIYDRHYFTYDDPNREFPKEYTKYTQPAVPFSEIENVYKESLYSLNINTETKSKTMFARRVFELMLCNTLVISNYSTGMEELFGDNIIFIDREELDLSNFELKRSTNLYEVLRYHTYSRRFKQILDAINYEYLLPDDSVTLYYIVNKESEIKNILEHYELIDYKHKKLALLISGNIPNHNIKNIYEEYTNNEISVYSLNYLMNQDGIINNNTTYFIFADEELMPEFVEKSILHYSYVEKGYSITTGENKYTFGKSNIINNTIMNNEMFEEVSDHVLHNIPIEIPVYYI